jgi:hypothetical protein
MAVENHPKFPEWKEALEGLILAKDKFRNGGVSQEAVDAALKAYHKIADEL